MNSPTGDAQRIGLLLGCLALPFVAAGIGSLFTSPAIPGWYEALSKPWFTPPNWVFGPVWTVLYLLQGIALYLVARTQQANKGLAIGVFLVQLICNALWPIVFFGAHQVAWALIVIVLLLFLIIVTMQVFRGISRLAAWLLLPYALWTSYATALNIGILVLNK